MNSVPKSRTVSTRQELSQIVGEIRDAVAAGVLRQVIPDPSQHATNEDISELGSDGTLPDFIEMRFDVIGSSIRYKLVVEVYHGGGGTWARERPS
jgi:hypothetical protein